MSEVVDARGLSCPMPVIRTKAALDSMDAGEIKVLLDEEVAKENVSRLAGSLGCKVNVTENDGEFELVIRKNLTTDCLGQHSRNQKKRQTTDYTDLH